MTGPGGFGARLRAAREARGLSLRQIAASTKISMLALEALEREDIARLPGGLFSRAFVRAFSREVGLDPEQEVREFVERFGDDGDPVLSEAAIRARASRRDHDSAPSQAGLRWLGLAITVALIVAFLFFLRHLMGPSASSQAPAPKATLTAPQPAQPAAGVDLVAAPSSARSTTPAAPDHAQAAGVPNPSAGGAAGQVPAAEPVAPVSPAEPATARLRLALSVDAECWVSAKADNRQVVRETLKAGGRVEMAAADVIVLTVGNPSAVVYTLNGMPGRPLGPPNQVVTVVITRDNAQTFTK